MKLNVTCLSLALLLSAASVGSSVIAKDNSVETKMVSLDEIHSQLMGFFEHAITKAVDSEKVEMTQELEMVKLHWQNMVNGDKAAAPKYVKALKLLRDNIAAEKHEEFDALMILLEATLAAQ